MFDTGKVASGESVLVEWPGKPLGSRGQAYWQVRVWDKEGKASAWSEAASIEMGVLNAAGEWKGQWITVDMPRYDMVEGPLAQASWISAGRWRIRRWRRGRRLNCRRMRRWRVRFWTPMRTD